jgi:hypothetical protein
VEWAKAVETAIKARSGLKPEDPVEDIFDSEKEAVYAMQKRNEVYRNYHWPTKALYPTEYKAGTKFLGYTFPNDQWVITYESDPSYDEAIFNQTRYYRKAAPEKKGGVDVLVEKIKASLGTPRGNQPQAEPVSDPKAKEKIKQQKIIKLRADLRSKKINMSEYNRAYDKIMAQ